MFSFIKNIFKTKTQKKWLDTLVDNIEKTKKEGVAVPMRIVDVKNKGFVVKTQGLFAYLPFSLMPWKYPNIEHWKYVYHSLKEKTLFGKIIQVERNPKTEKLIKITVDANSTKFKNINLSKSKTYSGIIVQKAEYGFFIDIGYHFKWRHGSLLGLLHNSKLPELKYHSFYEEGQIIEVNCLKKDDNYLLYKIAGTSDFRESYVGKTVSVTVKNSENNKQFFLVENVHQAVMPFKKNIYGEKQLSVINFVKSLSDGDVINCEVIDINMQSGCLMIKFLSKNDEGNQPVI